MKNKKIIISAIILILVVVATTLGLVFGLKGCKDNPKEPEKVTITLDAGDIENLNTDYNSEIQVIKDEPQKLFDEIPMQADKMFYNWYYDSDLTLEVSFPATFSENTTLYAKYLDGNLPSSFIEYSAETDSYRIIKGTETLPETCVIPDFYTGTNGIKPITEIKRITKATEAQFASTVKELYVGNNITDKTGYCMCYKNGALKKAYMPRVTSLDASFYNCTNLEEIYYPNIKYIGYSVFADCYNLPITIPDGVVWIGDYAFDHAYVSQIGKVCESITIPKSVVQIGGRSFVGDNEENEIMGSHIFYDVSVEYLKEFKVEEGNEHFKAVDGVLYTKSLKYLISYPAAKTDERYQIVDGCVDLFKLSFSKPFYLKTLVLPKSLVIHGDDKDEDGNYLTYEETNLSSAIYHYSTLENFELTSDNTNYMVDDGILYTADGKELLCIPVGKAKNGTLTFRNELETINFFTVYTETEDFTYNGVALGGHPSKIVIGENVKNINEAVLNQLINKYFSNNIENHSSYFDIVDGKLQPKQS